MSWVLGLGALKKSGPRLSNAKLWSLQGLLHAKARGFGGFGDLGFRGLGVRV